ncbi:MAG: hypothetical protein RJQ00_07240 [Vicingaceae bacterium]
MSGSKSKFLLSNIWALSWNASVQHAKIYEKEVNSNVRKDISNNLKDYFENQISKEYKSTVSAKKHINNIELFQEFVISRYSTFLHGGKYRFGVAQKLFNLYLKQLWVLDLIPSPPHFPIDELIQDLLRKKASKGLSKNFYKIKWTKNDSVEDYMMVINFAEHVKSELGYKDLATLELELYNILL